MADEKAAEFSVLAVIPCLNEERHLKKVVLGLLGSRMTVPMRIVIADGGSKDSTLHVAQELAAQYPNVVILGNPRRIQSSAINLAVAQFGAGIRYMIRIDAHAEYARDYCQSLIEEAEFTQAASVVVAMKTAGIGWFQRAVAAAQNSRLGNGGSAHRLPGTAGSWTDHGHHALMRIDAFLQVGGYDESFSHNEDAELDMRLLQAGFTIWLTAKTSLTYYPRSSPAALFRQYVEYGAGRARTILKHRAIPKLRQLAPAAVLPLGILALAAPFFWPAALPLAIWAMFCLGYGIVLGLKAKSTSTAAASTLNHRFDLLLPSGELTGAMPMGSLLAAV